LVIKTLLDHIHEHDGRGRRVESIGFRDDMAVMRKFLLLSALMAMGGCAMLPFGGPPAATAPTTPVFFQPLSTALDADALSAIASAAAAAAQQPDESVTVVGAADTAGGTDANKALSRARARAVAAQLAADGVAAGRIHAWGIGEAGHAGNHAQANRRVLITIGGG
jgi:outer membrane protein OmpA-like peptidoglycan-associated protein